MKRINYKQLLDRAKKEYPQGAWVDVGHYQAKVAGEIKYSDGLKTIVCDSCPIYDVQKDLWYPIIGHSILEIRGTEKRTVKTTKGEIILQKFGRDFVSLQNNPIGLNKECKTYIALKKTTDEELQSFVGKIIGWYY